MKIQKKIYQNFNTIYLRDAIMDFYFPLYSI